LAARGVEDRVGDADIASCTGKADVHHITGAGGHRNVVQADVVLLADCDAIVDLDTLDGEAFGVAVAARVDADAAVDDGGGQAFIVYAIQLDELVEVDVFVMGAGADEHNLAGAGGIDRRLDAGVVAAGDVHQAHIGASGEVKEFDVLDGFGNAVLGEQQFSAHAEAGAVIGEAAV